MMKRVKELNEEIRRLNKMDVYQREIVGRNCSGGARQKKDNEAISSQEVGATNSNEHGVNIVLACETFRIVETYYRYQDLGR